jgi:hypothetical protein
MIGYAVTSRGGLFVENAMARRIKGLGFFVATLVGLVVIQYVYNRIMPYDLQVGQLLALSVIPFTYPPAYWLTHLVLTTLLLGSLAWMFKLRGGKLLGYLLLMYFISLLGPIWMFVVDIYFMPARRPYS